MTTADTVPAPPITEARIASPWIVAVPNQKGGVGKTTMALALAAVTADANGRALVVDVDPQSSSADMAGRMLDPGFDFSHEMDPGMLTRLRELRAYDMVFIDCPGSLEGGQILIQFRGRYAANVREDVKRVHTELLLDLGRIAAGKDVS